MARSPAVDNYLFDRNEEVRLTIEVLREIIFSAVKGVEEEFKWNCPFYSKNGFLCYINFEQKTKKVVLAFVEGFCFKDKYNVLSSGTKNIRKLYVPNIAMIDEKMIRYFLKQAVDFNKVKPKNFSNIKNKR